VVVGTEYWAAVEVVAGVATRSSALSADSNLRNEKVLKMRSPETGRNLPSLSSLVSANRKLGRNGLR
jgi:hypothetical protein